MRSSHARATPYLRPLALAGLAVAAMLLALLPADTAEAQLRTNRLGDEQCVVGEFTSFDDVIMTALATHQSGGGDVYQAICDDEDCWGFSINRAAAVNVLSIGLTPGEYTWYVCAWNGSVRRVVANLAGGAALYRPTSTRPGDAESEAETLSLQDPRVPDAVRRFAERLGRVPRH